MKKSTKGAAAKKLLLSSQKVRDLSANQLENVVGGQGCQMCDSTLCGNGTCHALTEISR